MQHKNRCEALISFQSATALTRLISLLFQLSYHQSLLNTTAHTVVAAEKNKINHWGKRKTKTTNKTHSFLRSSRMSSQLSSCFVMWLTEQQKELLRCGKISFMKAKTDGEKRWFEEEGGCLCVKQLCVFSGFVNLRPCIRYRTRASAPLCNSTTTVSVYKE